MAFDWSGFRFPGFPVGTLADGRRLVLPAPTLVALVRACFPRARTLVFATTAPES